MKHFALILFVLAASCGGRYAFAAADATKPETKQLTEAQLKALGAAYQPVQQLTPQLDAAELQYRRVKEAMDNAQRTWAGAIANVQKECGCQVQLKDGKLVGVVNPAPAKQESLKK